jgi:hypothetical protein
MHREDEAMTDHPGAPPADAPPASSLQAGAPPADAPPASSLQAGAPPADAPPNLAPGPAPDERTAAGTASGNASVGHLVSDVSRDVSTLVRKEIELAKAELREEATKAGKSIGMFAGASGAGYFAVLFGLLAAVFGLAEVMATALAALIVTMLLLLVSIILMLRGRSAARSVHPTPTRTVQTLKEDVQWARRRTK